MENDRGTVGWGGAWLNQPDRVLAEGRLGERSSSRGWAAGEDGGVRGWTLISYEGDQIWRVGILAKLT